MRERRVKGVEAETSTPASQPASLPLCLSAWLPGCLAVCRGPVLPESAVLWLDDGAEAKPSLTHGTVDLFRGMESCTAWPNLPRISNGRWTAPPQVVTWQNLLDLEEIK